MRLRRNSAANLELNSTASEFNVHIGTSNVPARTHYVIAREEPFTAVAFVIAHPLSAVILPIHRAHFSNRPRSLVSQSLSCIKE